MLEVRTLSFPGLSLTKPLIQAIECLQATLDHNLGQMVLKLLTTWNIPLIISVASNQRPLWCFPRRCRVQSDSKQSNALPLTWSTLSWPPRASAAAAGTRSVSQLSSEYNKGRGIPGIHATPAAAPLACDAHWSSWGPSHHYRPLHNPFTANLYVWVEKCRVWCRVWHVLLHQMKGHFVKLSRGGEECQGQWSSFI